MDSEVDLDEEVKKMHIIATAPSLYPSSFPAPLLLPPFPFRSSFMNKFDYDHICGTC